MFAILFFGVEKRTRSRPDSAQEQGWHPGLQKLLGTRALIQDHLDRLKFSGFKGQRTHGGIELGIDLRFIIGTDLGAGRRDAVQFNADAVITRQICGGTGVRCRVVG
jgi:hypothetical protein